MRKVFIICSLLLSSCITKPPAPTEEDSEASLTEELGKSCQTDFGEVPSRGSFYAYEEPNVALGLTCKSELRTCIDGKLTGTYSFVSCFEGAPIQNEGDMSVVIPDTDSAEQ